MYSYCLTRTLATSTARPQVGCRQKNQGQIAATQRARSIGKPWVSDRVSEPSAPAGKKATRCESEWELTSGVTPPLAAQVVTSRVGYTHHGIHVGDGRVVHYSGLSRGWRGGPVEEVSLAEFARGRPIRVRVHADARFDQLTVVARARSRLGEACYRALTNNCEHFCEWSIHGEHRSRQVEVLRSRSLKVVQALRRLVNAPLRVVALLGRHGSRRRVSGQYVLSRKLFN